MKRGTLTPATLTEAMSASEAMARSQLVPKEFVGKPSNILVAMQWGNELGLSPMQSLQNIAIINGKPTMYGDALLALVRADPRCLGVEETVSGEGDKRVATCTIKRGTTVMADGREAEEVTRTFNVADAKQAKLWNKQGPWQQYPERMLQMRARGFCMRDAFPDVLRGVITTEEADDYPPAKDMGKVVEVEETREERNAEVEALVAGRMVAPAEVVEDDNGLWHLNLPGKEPEICGSEDEWSGRYAGVLLTVRQAGSLAVEERWTKMKAFEDVNAKTLDRIDQVVATELRKKRKTYNRGMAKEREPGEEG
jgi:hypothetical protein